MHSSIAFEIGNEVYEDRGSARAHAAGEVFLQELSKQIPFSEILQFRPSKVVRSNSLIPLFSNQEESPMARPVQDSLRPRRPEVR